MTSVRKAVITAAGRGTRQFPASHTVQKELFPLVDVDGYAKPTLQIIVEEVLAAGIEEVCIIANPGNIKPMWNHFQGLSAHEKGAQFDGKLWALGLSDTLEDIGSRITFVVQNIQDGFGHAVFQAREWVGDEPFVLLLGDHVYRSHTDKRCTQQVLDAFSLQGCAVSSVARTPEAIIHRFGTVGGTLLPNASPPTYEIREIVEKPTASYAHQHLQVANLPTGEYLCFFGINVFLPSLFEILQHLIDADIREKGEIQLASAQALLCDRERYVVCEVDGERFDMGVPEGLIETQLALALHSPHAAAVRALFHRLENSL